MVNGSGDDSEYPSDSAQPSTVTSERNRQQLVDFDIDAFLGSQGRTADQDSDTGHSVTAEWRDRFLGNKITRSSGDILVSMIIAVTKKIFSAAVLVFLAVLLVFGPNADWNQLKWNILRGGASEESLALCEGVGEWFSVFDQHTDRIYRLLDDAGPPDTWDEATLNEVVELLPVYMDDWLAEFQRNDPPPVGQRMNALYISLLENFEALVEAAANGDEKAQRDIERENIIILNGIEIETRRITNLCI